MDYFTNVGGIKVNCSIASFNVNADVIKSEYITLLTIASADVKQHSSTGLYGPLPVYNF